MLSVELDGRAEEERRFDTVPADALMFGLCPPSAGSSRDSGGKGVGARASGSLQSKSRCTAFVSVFKPCPFVGALTSKLINEPIALQSVGAVVKFA
jgi:hypothetical protein